MSFTELELKDICLDMHQGINTVADKVEYRSKGIPIIQSKNITSGYLDLDDVRYLDIDDYEKYKDKYNPNKGDILLCNIGTIGTSLVLKQDSKFLIAWNLFKLKIDTERFNPKYIKYYLDKLKLINYFDKLLTGGTVKFINKTKMGQIRIPICDIRKQDKIISVLDKAQELIDKRKEQIEALDELVKSQFIEMFGDPFNDEKGFGTNKLGEVTGVNPKKAEIKDLDKELLVSFVPMDRVGEKGEFNPEVSKSIGEVYSGFTYFRENDVLFAKITPCMENGKGAVAVNLSNGIGFGSTEFHVLRPLREKSNSYWIYHLTTLIEFRRLAERKMTGSAGQKRVPTDFLNNIQVVVPPIELQNQFADFVKQVDKLKFEMEKSLKELEDNFNSLMQKAFKGELFN